MVRQGSKTGSERVETAPIGDQNAENGSGGGVFRRAGGKWAWRRPGAAGGGGYY